METLHGRLEREHRTLVCMTRIYCKDHHPGAPGADLCPDCRALMEYAERRLAKCPYGTEKPTCAKCPIHCYKPAPREQARVNGRVQRLHTPPHHLRVPRDLGHLDDVEAGVA